jgi:hypothetical protein
MERLKIDDPLLPELQKLMAVSDRIVANDKTAIAEFREKLKSFPQLAAKLCDEFGNPAKRAERELIKKLTGDQLLHCESHTLKLEAMRTELARPESTPLEKLLVERVLVCWLQTYHADLLFYSPDNMPADLGEFRQRQQDRAHRRFLSACKTLAAIRRLALPIRVDVNVAGTVETKNTAPPKALDRFRLPVGSDN